MPPAHVSGDVFRLTSECVGLQSPMALTDHRYSQIKSRVDEGGEASRPPPQRRTGRRSQCRCMHEVVSGGGAGALAMCSASGEPCVTCGRRLSSNALVPHGMRAVWRDAPALDFGDRSGWVPDRLLLADSLPPLTDGAHICKTCCRRIADALAKRDAAGGGGERATPPPPSSHSSSSVMKGAEDVLKENVALRARVDQLDVQLRDARRRLRLLAGEKDFLCQQLSDARSSLKRALTDAHDDQDLRVKKR